MPRLFIGVERYKNNITPSTIFLFQAVWSFPQRGAHTCTYGFRPQRNIWGLSTDWNWKSTLCHLHIDLLVFFRDPLTDSISGKYAAGSQPVVRCTISTYSHQFLWCLDVISLSLHIESCGRNCREHCKHWTHQDLQKGKLPNFWIQKPEYLQLALLCPEFSRDRADCQVVCGPPEQRGLSWARILENLKGHTFLFENSIEIQYFLALARFGKFSNRTLFFPQRELHYGHRNTLVLSVFSTMRTFEHNTAN